MLSFSALRLFMFLPVFHWELIEKKEPPPPPPFIQSLASCLHLAGQAKCSNLMDTDTAASDWIATCRHRQSSSFPVCPTQHERVIRECRRTTSQRPFDRRGIVWTEGWVGRWRGGGGDCSAAVCLHREVARKPWDPELQLKHFTVLVASQKALRLLWAVEEYLRSTFHPSQRRESESKSCRTWTTPT